MHPPEIRAEALALVEAGLNDCEISRRMGIPRGTIRDWRRPRYVKKTPEALCPRCWLPAKPMRFSDEDYAALLGLYLGDGLDRAWTADNASAGRTGCKYPRIIEATRALLSRCFPGNAVDVIRKKPKGKMCERLGLLEPPAVRVPTACAKSEAQAKHSA